MNLRVLLVDEYRFAQLSCRFSFYKNVNWTKKIFRKLYDPVKFLDSKVSADKGIAENKILLSIRISIKHGT